MTVGRWWTGKVSWGIKGKRTSRSLEVKKQLYHRAAGKYERSEAHMEDPEGPGKKNHTLDLSPAEQCRDQDLEI